MVVIVGVRSDGAPAWRDRALCVSVAIDVFYPYEGESRGVWGERSEIAKAICRRCPVRALCEAAAVLAREPEGIWGGHSFPARWRTPRRALARAVARGDAAA